MTKHNFKTLSRQIVALHRDLLAFAIKVERRFEQTDRRFDRIERRFDRLDRKLDVAGKNLNLRRLVGRAVRQALRERDQKG